MNNNIIECIFEFYNFKNIINSTLIVKPKNDNISYGYKIDSFLGDGSVGNVYLLELLNKK